MNKRDAVLPYEQKIRELEKRFKAPVSVREYEATTMEIEALRAQIRKIRGE